MHLYLLGLPGAGKTTLGRQLAARYGRAFRGPGRGDCRPRRRAQLHPGYFRGRGRGGLSGDGKPVSAARGGRPGWAGRWWWPRAAAHPAFTRIWRCCEAAGLALWLEVPVLGAGATRLARGPAGLASRPLLAAQAPTTASAAHASITPARRPTRWRPGCTEPLAARRAVVRPAPGCGCADSPRRRPGQALALLAAAGFRGPRRRKRP
ncbi:MAG: hypothetical protein WKG07_44645 [Hymenobacter sp.]